ARLLRSIVAHDIAALWTERRSAALAVDRELPSLLPRGFDVDDLAGNRIERLGRRLLLALHLRHLLARRPRRGSAVDLRPEVEVGERTTDGRRLAVLDEAGPESGRASCRGRAGRSW